MIHWGSGAQGGFWTDFTAAVSHFRRQTPAATSEHTAPTTNTTETLPNTFQVSGGKEKKRDFFFFFLIYCG